MENASPYPVTTYYFLILIFPLFPLYKPLSINYKQFVHH